MLAVSGGGDSVALLRALHRLGAKITVAHLNHGLLGDAGEVAEFVGALAGELGVPFTSERVDTRSAAARQGRGIEETARRLRFGFLHRVAAQSGASAIVLAHTLEDQAETVLLQLLRGTAKAAGMAERRGRVRRPWLGLRREQLRRYLRWLGQDWREDPSNADLSRNRNWLRHAVLPDLRQRFPGADLAIARLAAQAGGDERWLGELLVQRVLPKTLGGGERLDLLPKPLLQRYAVDALRARRLHVEAALVETICAAVASPTPRRLTLSGGVAAEAGAGGLWISRPLPPPAPPGLGSARLRHRRPGDFVEVAGKRVPLSELFRIRRVSPLRRDAIWLAAHRSQVCWLGLDPPWSSGQDLLPWSQEMGWALEEARAALAAGEVPVGAVVVAAGRVVARAHNLTEASGDFTDHGELLAIRAAAKVLGPHLDGAVLVATLEPCPMCFGAMQEARIRTLVYGADSPKSGALQLSAPKTLSDLHVLGGIRAAEAGSLLQDFFRTRRAGAV